MRRPQRSEQYPAVNHTRVQWQLRSVGKAHAGIIPENQDNLKQRILSLGTRMALLHGEDRVMNPPNSDMHAKDLC